MDVCELVNVKKKILLIFHCVLKSCFFALMIVLMGWITSTVTPGD